MSKAEILQELPALGFEERKEILERLCELEDRDLINGIAPTKDEKRMLDQELEEYRQNPKMGSSLTEVEARIAARK